MAKVKKEKEKLFQRASALSLLLTAKISQDFPHSSFRRKKGNSHPLELFSPSPLDGIDKDLFFSFSRVSKISFFSEWHHPHPTHSALSPHLSNRTNLQKVRRRKREGSRFFAFQSGADEQGNPSLPSPESITPFTSTRYF